MKKSSSQKILGSGPTTFFRTIISEWRGTPLFKQKKYVKGWGPSSFWNHSVKKGGWSWDKPLLLKIGTPLPPWGSLFSFKSWWVISLLKIRIYFIYFPLLPLQEPCRRSLNKVCSCFAQNSYGKGAVFAHRSIHAFAWMYLRHLTNGRRWKRRVPIFPLFPPFSSDVTLSSIIWLFACAGIKPQTGFRI